MQAKELRKKYIEFFVSKGHVQIPSASLIPENDPSVLFTTAGMHPLVPYLTGEEHSAGKRLVNFQKCVRTGDIDEVGDNTHLTFFEMLGNWSLGDYFKDESIEWSFEFLTSVDYLNIPVENLAFTVFAGDDDADFDQEAYDKWISLGVSESRIAKLGKSDNWWPVGGKHTGPQGPDTEIFYWSGEGDAPEKYNPENDEWVEIWNNVFMQFNKDESGNLTPLAKQNVDTGMGLERTIAVLQGKKSVYDTELFQPIFSHIEHLSSKKINNSNSRSFRIIADHLRAAIMIIGDGVHPAKDDRGYVPRKLIRRAVVEIVRLEGMLHLKPVINAIIETLKEAYPYLVEKESEISNAIQSEADDFWYLLQNSESKVQKTLEKYLTSKGITPMRVRTLKAGEEINVANPTISKILAFDLGIFVHDKIHATLGIPEEFVINYLTVVLDKFGYILFEDEKISFQNGFDSAMKKHQDLSRAGAGKKFAGGLADDSVETKRLHTATHLLHQALREVLGDHVEQRGSNITSERLRFDFSHGEKMTPEQKEHVEAIVNEQIKKAMPVHQELLTVEEAKERGAIGLFEDKYSQIGDKIKVYFMGRSTSSGERAFSTEICGGPHVENTSELGSFKIKKEEASSASIRRIKAILE